MTGIRNLEVTMEEIVKLVGAKRIDVFVGEVSQTKREMPKRRRSFIGEQILREDQCGFYSRSEDTLTEAEAYIQFWRETGD